MTAWNGLKRTPLKATTGLKRTPLKRGKGIRMVSKKQAVKNANWKKITDDKAASLNYICQWCGQPGQLVSPELPNYLDGHHKIKRRYNIHTDENCYIAHRFPCHRFIEDNNVDVAIYPNKEFWDNRENVIKTG
jgi:hypothetical protein